MKTERQKTLAVRLARILCEARHDYCRRLKRCRKTISEKTVHRLRVETRRLLALLDFLETTRFDESLDKPRKLLKKGLDAFDDLRDTHVELELLEPLWVRFSDAKPLKKLLRRHEEKLIKKARKKLKHAGLGELSQILKQLEKGIGHAAFASGRRADHALIIAALQKSFECVVKCRRQIHGKDAPAIHQMRVAFKRFRYMSELLQPFLPWATEARLQQMKKFQTVAGEIQDLEILLTRLDEIVCKEKMSATELSGLRDELSRRKHRAMDFFMGRIDELAKFRPQRRATETFAEN